VQPGDGHGLKLLKNEARTFTWGRCVWEDRIGWGFDEGSITNRSQLMSTGMSWESGPNLRRELKLVEVLSARLAARALATPLNWHAIHSLRECNTHLL